jgi:uncharacterized protein YxeA
MKKAFQTIVGLLATIIVLVVLVWNSRTGQDIALKHVSLCWREIRFIW